MLQGSINHVSVTVSDLDEAMGFFAPVLGFLGYTLGRPADDPSTGTRLTVNLPEAATTEPWHWARPVNPTGGSEK